MRFTLLTTGTRGDVQPLLALAVGLQEAGHEVKLATDPSFEKLIRQYNIEFAPMNCNTQFALEKLREVGKPGLKLMREAVAQLNALVGELNEGAWEACQGAEGVIAHFGVAGAYYMAQQLNLPYWQVALQPLYPTAQFPSPAIPTFNNLPGFYNRLTHKLIEQYFWQVMRPTLGKWLRQHDLPYKPAFFGPFKEQHRKAIPMLHAYSSALVPRPADYPPQAHLTGYWFLEQSAEELSNELSAFLEADKSRPPVYIGFGSMPFLDPTKIGLIISQTLARLKLRAVIATGDNSLSLTGLPDDQVLKIVGAPHQPLFPRCQAIVHHGGAGTTATALRAGVPSVIVPFMPFGGSEQFFWGQRVHAAGAGSAPLTLAKLNTERLTLALGKVTTDKAIRRRAAQLSENIRAENGVQEALKIIFAS